MKKIENYEEFISLWNVNHKNRYWGCKKITLEHEQEIIEKANIADFKRYDIYILDDGYYFIIDNKCAIDSVMYYDDEQEAPKITLEYFKAKNQMNFKYSKIENEERMKPYFSINYNNSKEVYIIRDLYLTDYYDNLKWVQDKGLFVRFLTDEEIQQYNNLVEELEKQYNERLEKYFKKYNNKIYAQGYWANR